jgi:hypothetical protein
MNRKLIFALFAAAILFAMIREWSTAVACPRLEPSLRSDRPSH